MQTPTTAILYPSTPSSRRSYRALSFQPLSSSPLASPKTSPVAEAQARRRSQYKARTPSTSGSAPIRKFSASSSSDPPKTLFKEQFQARCLERARNAREKKIKGCRSITYESSSDGFDMDMGDEKEEDDEDVMQDELFRRIMENATRKNRHEYRLSYADAVGSSFDPDMEDVSRWETELRDNPASEVPVLTPEDLENEELAAYAEEHAALADFEEVDVDDPWSLSDLESEPGEGASNDAMDMTS